LIKQLMTGIIHSIFARLMIIVNMSVGIVIQIYLYCLKVVIKVVIYKWR